MATNTHETTPNRFLEAGGIKYAYRRFGAPHGVPMVFLQHFRGSMDNWDPLLTNGFAKSRPVILFDNAGVGLSGGSVPDTIGGMADKALEVIDAVGLTQINLLGFSMGGSIAQILTLKRPSLVRRLILAGTGPGGGDGILPPDPRVMPILTSGRSGREERLMLFFEATETSQAAGRRYWDRTLTRQGEKDPFASVEAGKVMLTAIGKFSKGEGAAYPRLGEIKPPTLVANGNNDIMNRTSNSFVMFQRLPNAQLILYPDSGHGFLFQYPELFVEHVTLFLNA